MRKMMKKIFAEPDVPISKPWTMKKSLFLFAIFSILFLLSVTVASTAETGFGWTVGSAYDGRGSILYTNDSGQSWRYQGTGQIANVDMSGVYAVNGRTAYVVGEADSGYGTIYRTTDAGATWTRLGSAADIPDVALAKVHSYGNQKIWAVGTGTILNSSDGGATWRNTCPAEYSSTLLQGVTTTDGRHVWVTGGNKDGYATILYSDNGGASWTRQGTAGDVTGVDHVIGVAAADNKKLWAVGGGAHPGNIVLATTDGGARWIKVHDAGLGDGNEVSVVDARTVWTAMDSHVLLSLDGGATWESHNTESYTMGISAFSADQVWAVANGIRGAIFYTADGGATPWNRTLTGPDGAVLPQLFTISMSTSTKEVYPQAVENAKAHADAPTGWVAAGGDMVKVSGAASVGANPYGLKYYGMPANNQLIVRTVSSSNAYNGAWGTTTTAGTNYAIYGSKSAMSAWVTTGNEMTRFIDGQGLTAGTVVKGLERGLGMNNTGTHDAIFEMAVMVGNTANPYLLRPTRNPDPTVYSTNPADHGTYSAFPADAQAAGIGTGAAADAVYANYKAAYINWAEQAYSTSPFPWTQLGYTYYWGQVENVPSNLNDVQGMSEFILLGGAGHYDPSKTPSGTDESGKVVAVGIYAPQSYIYTKNNGTTLSDDATAQYGNGFASFNVTGACDTLWAGAAFQVGAHLDAATPNTITIGTGETVSGGQGILVGSRNYTVMNAGLITATANTKKFNITDSENVALLFKGDTHAVPYIGDVKNILINSGTITAPGDNGTAVMVWAGNTDITNTGTITGSGNGYAIKTASGNDTIRIDDGAVTGHIDLGTGIDALVVRTSGTVTGRITTGDNATVMVDGGTLNMTGGVISAGGVTGRNNADVVNISGGVVNGGIQTGAGNDTVALSGGQVNGSINLGSNIADAFSANNATLGFAISRNTQATAKIQGMQTANIADTGSVTLIPRIAEPTGIRDQESFLIVVPNAGGSLQTDIARINIQNDASYPMIRFSLSQNGNDLSLIASRDNRYYAQGSGNSSLGAVLDALAGSGNSGADMQRVLGALDASGDAANAARLQPVVDNGVLQASRAALGGFLGAVNDRLNHLRSGQTLAATGNSIIPTLGAVLDALAGSGNAGADMQRVIGTLDASGDAANAARFQPVVDNGISPARRAVWGGLPGADTGRMDHLRYGQPLADAGNSIISTGGASGDQGMWARGLGSYLHQGARDASNGYDANLWGVATGYDVLLREDLRFGGGFGYAKNQIKSKDNSGDAAADSFQGTLYAGFTKNAGYINGSLSLSYNCYRSSRQIVFPGVNRTANSEYDGQQYSLYLEGGHTLKTGRFALTPLASIQYENLRLDGYTEKNAGDLNLKVDRQNYNMALTGVGLKLGYSVQGSYGTFIPELHAKWLYDLMNDKQQSTATFTGGGASFATSGFKPARSSYHLGTKISLITMNNIELSVDYDFEFKNDFYGHSGYVNARYAF